MLTKNLERDLANKEKYYKDKTKQDFQAKDQTIMELQKVINECEEIN